MSDHVARGGHGHARPLRDAAAQACHPRGRRALRRLLEDNEIVPSPDGPRSSRMTVGARELAGEHRVPAHVGRGLGLRVRSREDRPATAAWRLCSRPTRAESRQREACIGRARCRTRSTAYSAAPAAETLTRCRPSACLQAIGARDGRRASSRRRALPRRRACRAGRRGSGLRCPSCSTSCVGSALSHGFSNRLARDIVVIGVRFALQLWIAE